jgi:general secretion pathway protein C
VYIAYLAAKLTWLMTPQPTPENIIGGKTVNFNQNSQQISKPNIDISMITTLNLFGHYQAQKVNEQVLAVQEAPETRLNLTLTGVVTSSNKDGGAAIIENAGTQETYGIGDKIAGTRATLTQVLNDRVLIKQSGRLETLMLDGIDYKKFAAANQQKPTGLILIEDTSSENNDDNTAQVDKRKNQALAQRMKEIKDDIADNPGKISDYLKISRVTEAGETIGYKLMPSGDNEFFDAAGLKTDDIAIAINGYDLTDPEQAVQALKALQEETEISLTVNRQGDNAEILFSINK